MVRAFSILVVAAACSATLAADPTEVFAFVQKSCIGCHNTKVKSGNVDLKATQTPKTFEEDRETWEKVVEKLKTGQMPPPGSPRPPDATILNIAHWLESEFARQDRMVKPDAGRVNARRLNRADYNNTIRDLLGIDIRPADNFPADTAAYGFDNISDALNLSPELLEKYVDAAERAVRTALFGPERLKPSAVHYSAPVRINDSRSGSALPKDLFHYDLTGLSTLHSAHFIHRFPVDAEYSFRLVLNGHRPNQSEPAHPALFIDGKLIKEFEVDATDLEGQIVEVRAPVTAGEHLLSETYLRAYHGLPPSYNGPEPSTRPPEPLISARGKLTEKDIETLRKYGTRIKTDSIEKRVDNRFESIDVGGPFNQVTTASPESLRHIYVCGHAPGKHNDSCARTIVTAFAGRAFRRPVTPREVDQYLGFVTLARQQGDSFEEGIATALQAILVSPNFLYRIERDRPVPAGSPAVPVGSYELASRLSYFLWSSMPDVELLRVAGQGKLREPAVLEAQVKRMLRDPKSSALVENFAGQWLQFKNIDVVRPDLERFPMFDEGLRQAMRRETELLLESTLREDKSIATLLDTDYTFVNERLAEHYGIEGIYGSEFRRISINDPRRRGLLGQASILTVTSYPNRTSPTIRGKWILEQLLGTPPPPPPPNVPSLKDDASVHAVTMRQRMEQHRANPACAVCHRLMDPLGFSLENFDGLGRWRDSTGPGSGTIDSSGVLPDGTKFSGPEGLREVLLDRRDSFVETFTERLLTYALGRGVEEYDQPVIRKIVRDAAADDRRWSAIILGIVKSTPFQMKRVNDGDS
jgi:mono/diheme cytochrome c family protein